MVTSALPIKGDQGRADEENNLQIFEENNLQIQLPMNNFVRIALIV
jgi:hypothetical protein